VDQRPVLTVFRSRLRDDAGDLYDRTAARMLELARGMPGFIDFKQFRGDDGERVSIIVFDSIEHEAAWRHHPEHTEAQRLGRANFYSSYDISVCEVLRRSVFPT